MSIAVLALLLFRPGGAPLEGIHIKAAEVAYVAGSDKLKNHQPAEAVKDFKHAIDIEPTFADAYHQLALVYISSGEPLEAGATLTQLLEIEPERNADRILLGRLLIAQKQNERALAQFSLVLRRDSLNAEALLGFAAAAQALGMEDRAAAALEKGRSKYPADARFRTAKSRAPESK